ncbi:MAG: ABC transporter permease [Dehalococcoidia bacterium]
MTAYIVRRVMSSVLVALLVSLFVFLAINLQSGSVIEADIAASGIVSQDQIEELRRDLKLDRSPMERYLTWWRDAFIGCQEGETACYGNSLRVRGVSIWSRVGDALPYSIEMLVLSLLISFIVAIPIGTLSALHQDTALDYVLRLVAILGVAVPTFFIGTLVVIYGSRWFNYAPPTSIPYFWDGPLRNIAAFIPPALILGYALAAVTMRMTRSTMLEILRHDYVRTARAKGLHEGSVIRTHAFRNALIPVITIIGNQAAFLIGGSVIVERIFNVPGMGWLAYTAIAERDYTQVLATTMVLTVGVILVNLLVDICYAVIDPRIRYA